MEDESLSCFICEESDACLDEEDESLSCFICEESDACLDEEDEETSVDDGPNGVQLDLGHHDGGEDTEYVKLLLGRETSHGLFQGDPRWHRHDDHGDWIKRARLDAFSWILNTRAFFGFQFQTAYLSMTYFDQFLSRRSPVSEDDWAIRLLAVACLSLAAKMEEVRVPLLSEFNAKDHSFQGEVVQGMELLLLKTLEWRMGLVTPFLFLHFLVSTLSDRRLSNELVPKAIRFILGVTKEINILDHRPSTIAAAAVLAVSSSDLTREATGCKLNSDSCCARLDIDAVFSCYGIMQGLDVDKFLSAGPTMPPDPTSSIACSESSLSFTSPADSTSNSKRRRLAFDETERMRKTPGDKK